MTRAPMTPEGKEKIAEELNHMKKVERPKIIKDIEIARAHGDLSENAEYHAAREKQGMLEARIRVFEDQLARAEVIDVTKLNCDRVVFGVCVTVFDETTDQEKMYRIVGELEADIEKGFLSITSPIAKALIGKEEGDTATVHTPGGTKELAIVKISI